MKYILMHRETVVAVLSVNDISGTVYRVDDVLQPAHLPIGLYAPDHKELAKNLNLWLAGRTIPASRSGFHRALEDLHPRCAGGAGVVLPAGADRKVLRT